MGYTVNVELLKRAMDRKGFTVKQLADEAGIDRRTINSYISGRTLPDALRMCAIGHALGLTFAEATVIFFPDQPDESWHNLSLDIPGDMLEWIDRIRSERYLGADFDTVIRALIRTGITYTRHKGESYC